MATDNKRRLWVRLFVDDPYCAYGFDGVYETLREAVDRAGNQSAAMFQEVEVGSTAGGPVLDYEEAVALLSTASSAAYCTRIDADGTNSHYQPGRLTLDQMQEAVGGFIQIGKEYEKFVLLVDEEGRLKGLPVNYAAHATYGPLRDGMAPVGPVLVVPRELWDDEEVEEDEGD